MPGKANLIKEHSALIADFKNQLNGTALACVVLDTLNRSLVGSENTEDMAEYTEAAEAIRAAFGCVVIIVHHCGYDPTHSRGHTSLPAAVDAELSVTRSEGSLYVAVTVKHMRDGPEGVVIRSRAETIPLDPDQNGKPRSSIVIVPDDNAVVVGTGHRGRQDSATPTLATAMCKLHSPNMADNFSPTARCQCAPSRRTTFVRRSIGPISMPKTTRPNPPTLKSPPSSAP